MPMSKVGSPNNVKVGNFREEAGKILDQTPERDRSASNSRLLTRCKYKTSNTPNSNNNELKNHSRPNIKAPSTSESIGYQPLINGA